MTHGLFACAAFALLAINAQPQPATVEAVQLAWNLEAGASYHIEMEVSAETETTSNGEVKAESQVLESQYRLFVEEVTEEGNMLLTITMDKYRMTQESAMLEVELEAMRDEDGEVIVSSTIESSIPELMTSEMEELFNTIGRNNLEMVFTFLLTPTGHVLESSLQGDPMGNLPTPTEITQMVALTASSMIDVENLPAALACGIFIQLPTDELEEGGEWESSVEFIVVGMEMDGTGACTIEGIEQDESTQSADINIQMDYSVGVDNLIEITIDMMENMFESMGVEMAVEVDMSGEDISVEMEAKFDVTDGVLQSMKFTDMVTVVEGTITVGENDIDLLVESSSSSHADWSRIEDDGE